MSIRVEPADLTAIESLRDDFTAAARCQIVRHSILPRGLADPWRILVGDRPIGYGAVWNRHFPGRLMEFHVAPEAHDRAPMLFAELLRASRPDAIEAQTNLPLAVAMLRECAANLRAENLLFEHGVETSLDVPGACVRQRADADDAPEGDWVVELDGQTVASGGFLTHYNPLWADLYYEVLPDARRRGIGSFFVQELRRRCVEAGWRPAARCDPDNEASRRTLARGGMRPCDRLLVGNVRDPDL